jgi:pimeloyl-ACP methyl ester carboxylesterase
MQNGASRRAPTTGLVAQSGFARFDVPRLVAGFRRFGGEEIAEIARRSFCGEPVTDEEWALVFAVFGPSVPDASELARRRQNPDLASHAGDLMRRLDVVDQLSRIECPTLVCVGELDPVTPVEASEETYQALPRQLARLEVLVGAGHFPWKDVGERYWRLLGDFVTDGARCR